LTGTSNASCWARSLTVAALWVVAANAVGVREPGTNLAREDALQLIDSSTAV
jgi:hypothetical protein